MRSSSSRLRLGAAVTATTLALFALGGTAVAGEGSGGSSADHRSDRATLVHAGESTDDTVVTEDTDTNDGGTPDGVADDGDNFHPSGKDRSVEGGNSGTQGSSASEPDGNGHGPERDAGGIDQADGPGGVDLADQDGNNGCGNDDDFEDDNEGWCGSKPKPGTPAPVGGPAVEAEGLEAPPVVTGSPEGGSVVSAEGIDLAATAVAPGAVLASELQAAEAAPLVETRVLGVSIERSAVADTATGGAGASVLGASFVRGSVLARTGFGLGALALLALGLVAVGWALQRAGRREHAA